MNGLQEPEDLKIGNDSVETNYNLHDCTFDVFLRIKSNTKKERKKHAKSGEKLERMYKKSDEVYLQ